MSLKISRNIDTLNKTLCANSFYIFIFSNLYSLYSLFAYYFEKGLYFAYFRVPKLNLTFGDLRSITYSSECNKTLDQLRDPILNCDPYKRPFNYPRLILDIFRKLKINIDHTNSIGLLFGLIISLAIIFFIFKYVNDKNLKFLISSIFLISSPTQLVIERANYDSLILVMMLCIPLFIDSLKIKNTLNLIIGIIISCLCIALKIYPAAGLISWRIYYIFLNDKKFEYVKELLLILIFSLTTFLTLNLNKLDLILRNTPKPTGNTSFGLNNLYQLENSQITSILFLATKILIILLILYKSHMDLSRHNFNIKIDLFEKKILNFFILFSLQILLLYILFSSWDYRLILILGIIPFLTNYWKIIPDKVIFINKKFIPYMGCFVMFQQYLPGKLDTFTSYFSDIILQPILVGFLISLVLLIYKKKY